ncbi:DEAD/DEAH box helicase [Microbacteriaceae bacterium VKM Ac-2855]|nr:DEAD/DEAH box helicase [Microbacteriaceae bacterium VKM Ac-2855]
MPSTEPTSTRADDWRSAVGELTRASGVAEGALTSIGLQLELLRLVRKGTDAWRPPTPERVTASTVDAADRADYRLGARPVIRGASGAWTRKNVTWKSLNFQTHRLSLHPGHQRWFAEFAALYAATRTVHLGQDPDWIFLDDYASPLVWSLLAQTESLGIALVGSAKDARVALGATARFTLDARRGDSTLSFTPTLEIDGGAVPLLEAGAVGDHGVYRSGFEPAPRILLAPTSLALTAQERRALTHPSGFAVPTAESVEFFREHLPALRRGFAVASSDDSVELPAPPPSALVLTARYEPRDVLRLRWHWERSDDRDAASDRTDHERRAAAEAVTLAAAAELVAVDLDDTTVLRGPDTASFSVELLPALRALPGVRVDVTGTAADYRALTGEPHLAVTVLETERTDWFDLGVTVTIDGRTVPFGKLFAALSRGQTKLLLVDKSYLSLAHPALQRLRELIAEAGGLGEWETTPSLSRYQAPLWDELEELADEAVLPDSWRAALTGLRVGDTVEHVAVPAGLTATLRPYQQSGFEWLVFLWRHGLGGILADDMGLGKTLQTLALIAHAVEAGEDRPFLVVAPTSVVPNWAAEASRFVPGTAVATVTRSSGRGSLAEIPDGSRLVITSYALFRLDQEAYRGRQWAGLVLDEAQFVKNPGSQAHESARDLGAPFTLALTGTPVENSLTDLWAILAVVAPGLLPPLRRFRDEYLRPIEHAEPQGLKGPDFSNGRTRTEAQAAAERLARLRSRIRPFLLRRTKELVAPELPEKQEQVLEVALDPRHQALYDLHLQRERQKLLKLLTEEEHRDHFIVFRSLTLLRMLSLDASLVDPDASDIPSAKLDALLEQLDEVVAEGKRALVFSTFTSFLDRASERLTAHGIPFVRLDGSTRDRGAVVERFRNGSAPVFLISLKAGGFGLTLTEADHVFILDPWWNPAAEEQAVDRTHRIGQDRRVNVYRLVAAGTIEEKIMRLKEKKRALTGALLDDGEPFSEPLTAEDIRSLLD